MSRLTRIDILSGEYSCYDPVTNVWFGGELADKVGRYEDLGEPEELAKVVRCNTCIQFRKYPFADDGLCLLQTSEVEPLYYCAKGQVREAASIEQAT